MSSKLIIVADMQHLKLYSIEKDPLGRESVNLLENIESLDIHNRIHESVSDQQGNFKGVGASGSGEDHNIQLEKEHRRIKEIAQQVSGILQKYKHESWYFSAPKAINNRIIELLKPIETETMSRNIPIDLANTPDNKILEHFNNN
ncbi:MAG: host attachment protein [Sulfuricurvum sp.]|nr:host attachment protein [Sulfuricurvum sp.]